MSSVNLLSVILLIIIIIKKGSMISFPVFYILFLLSLIGSLHIALHLIEIMFTIVVEAIWCHVVEVFIVEV